MAGCEIEHPKETLVKRRLRNIHKLCICLASSMLPLNMILGFLT
jgi:hypothetical protein